MKIASHIRFALAALLLLAPATMFAQSGDKVYAPTELTTEPKIAAPAAAGRAVARAYPPQLQKAGIGGQVELEIVVNADGKVDKSSIQVMSATVPALGAAAKTAAEQLAFQPGKVDGKPVRSRVVLPLTFKP